MNWSQNPAVDTLIVGGGQAGLAIGYWLAQEGSSFLIVDENARTGDSWRQRWDSLRLFTPGKYDGLPGGAPFPGDRLSFPTKDELADYLEDYKRRFDLPIVHNVRVDGLVSDGGMDSKSPRGGSDHGMPGTWLLPRGGIPRAQDPGLRRGGAVGGHTPTPFPGLQESFPAPARPCPGGGTGGELRGGGDCPGGQREPSDRCGGSPRWRAPRAPRTCSSALRASGHSFRGPARAHTRHPCWPQGCSKVHAEGCAADPDQDQGTARCRC